MSVNPEFVERYQLEYQKNPTSRVFAPLAEAYRKMGLIEEAKRLCHRGVQIHPDFAGGHVAYAKVLLDMKALKEALTQLEKAAQLSPDNLLAQSLLGDTLLELRRPKDALKAFKMVLFLNPNDEKARQAVRKWEFLTADEYGADVFAMKPVFGPQEGVDRGIHGDEDDDEADAHAYDDLLNSEADEDNRQDSDQPVDTRLALAQRHARALERVISLADALTVRNDLDAAMKVLEDGERLLGPMPEIESRLSLLKKRVEPFAPDGDPLSRDELEKIDPGSKSGFGSHRESSNAEIQRRLSTLEVLLQRINERRV